MNNTFSQYAKVFDETNPNYTGERKTDLMFLKCNEHYLNDLLRLRNKVLLNEAYNTLGFKREEIYRTVGWLYAETNQIGDNFVDFGIDYEYLSSHLEEPIVVDFNVDGKVANQYVENGVIVTI